MSDIKLKHSISNLNEIVSGFKDDGSTHDGIELVDVYQIFCHLLGFDPEPNDGIWDRVRGLLKNSSLALAPQILPLALAAAFTAWMGQSRSL